jgi:hypothetical protein
MKQRPLTTHAKIAPSLVRMSGLFGVAPFGQRRPFDVTQKTRDISCRLVGPELLSVDELEVLLGLIALAGAQTDSYRSHRTQTAWPLAIRVRRMLSRKAEVRTTYSELARELGRSAGGGTWPFIKQSIARLSSVLVSVQSVCGTEADDAPLIHSIQRDDTGGSIALALCPVLAAAVLGEPGEFIQIDMNHFRSLQDRSGVACALYFRLHGLLISTQK